MIFGSCSVGRFPCWRSCLRADLTSLVQARNHCDEAWADIDAELKRRYDLIPNLVSAVQGYAKHEREVLEGSARARAAAMANNGSPASQAPTRTS